MKLKFVTFSGVVAVITNPLPEDLKCFVKRFPIHWVEV